MELINELRNVWEPIEWPERRVLILLGLFGALIIAFLIIAKFHGHVFSLGPDLYYNASFEWSVPVGSPEIGVRPDGSVGSINEFGRISNV